MANALWNVMGKMNLRGPDTEYEDDYYEEEPQAWQPHEADVVRMPQVPVEVEAPTDLSRIVTVRPTAYGDDDMLALAKALKAGTPVIVHIGHMKERDQQSILDFMAGVVYALEANMEHVTAMVYLLSPKRVSIVDAEGNSVSHSRR